MRFKKASLVAASLLLSALPVCAVDVDVGTENYGTSMSIGTGWRVIFDAAFSGSILQLTGQGDFVKNGAGKLQYLGFQSNAIYFNSVQPKPVFGANVDNGIKPTSHHNLSGLPEFIGGGLGANDNALSGSITVNQGTLEVAGYLNDWLAYYTGMVTPDGAPLPTPQVEGVSGVILAGKGAEINFTNTPLNVFSKIDPLLGGTGGVLSKRYNMVRNIKSGANNDLSDTTFSAGADSTYRIVIYADNTAANILTTPALAALGAEGNSIGKLAGRGDVYKFGAADLKVLGDSERGVGRFTIAGGTVTLASAGGMAMATVESLNLAGGDSRQGSAIGANFKNYETSSPPDDYWKNAVTPTVATGRLILENSQTVRNLQADFAYAASGATVRDAVENSFSKTNCDEAVVAGTGIGSVITIGANTLTVLQERDGVYAGNIDATAAGVIVKKGAATLALLLGIGTDASVVIEQGVLLANAQALGTSVEVKGSGSFKLVQTNAGSLRAQIKGVGNLDVVASAYVNNGSGQIQINSEGAAGSVLFARVQNQFTGTVNAYDGVTLELSSIAVDALAGASSVTLHGTGSVPTTLRFGDSTQNVNRFSGDLNTRLDLARGTAVLHQDGDPLTFSGGIIGVGNLVQAGGTWTVDTTAASHFGATVVRGGGAMLQAGTVGLGKTSGLVLASGASFDAKGLDTAVGALFGQSGSVVNLGAGTLTVGSSSIRAAQLRQELAGGTPLSTNYLGTSATALDLSGTAISGFDVALLGGVAPADVADATRIFLAQQYEGASAAADAATLAFAGSIKGTGGLVKIGRETLRLSGVNEYTGATAVQAGKLAVNWNSVNTTSGVTLAAGSTLEVNADAASGNGAFLPAVASVKDAAGNPVAGAGTVRKVGAGEVTLAGDLAGFAGNLDVVEGTLQVNDAGDIKGAVDIAASARMVFNQAADAVATATVNNAGALEKSGAGKLTLGVYAGPGLVKVTQGTLSLTNFPVQLDVADGAVFESAIIGDGVTPVVCSTRVTGATHVPGAPLGTVRLIGSGTLPTLQAGAPDLFAAVSLDLIGGITFDLNGTAQTLGGFSGDAASSINLNGGTLAFSPAAGVNTVFSGNVIGAGSIAKTGAGSVTLATTAVQNWTGTVTVSEGTLIATPQALGGETGTNLVQLVATAPGVYGTFALYSADTTAAVTYGGSVSGQGVLAKTGAGEVVFTQGLVGFTSPAAGVAAVQVREGRLTTGDNGGDAVFASVQVARGASLRVNMSGARVLDASVADTLRGEGDLVAAGAQTLTLANGQNYTGLTELLDGATLAFSNTSLIHGLKGAAGTIVALSGDLRVEQAATAAYLGAFTGTGTLSVGGAGTLDLSAAGASGDLTGLALTVAAGGTVRVGAANGGAIVNDGTLEITDAGAPAARYAAALSGAGRVAKVGAGKLSFGDGVSTGVPGNPYVLGSTGGLVVREGLLGGNFVVRGGLSVDSGATLSPGNSPGTVTVATGDFTLSAGSTLLVEVNAVTADKVEVLAGAAVLSGALQVKQDSTGGSLRARGGQRFTVVSAAGGITGGFSNATNGFVFLDAADKAATGLDRVHLDRVGNDLVMTGVAGLADVSGYAPHEGLGGLVALLDAKGAPSAVQTAVDTTWGRDINAVLANLSPLGYASEYAMAQDGENQRQVLLHERLEQRRYDRASTLSFDDAPWEAFVVGGGTFVSNQDAADTATFDYRTFGGLVGLDRKVREELLVGAAAGYATGKSDLKNGGGKVDMNRVAGTLFMSTQLTKRWYLDLGATAGVGLYESKRATVVGGVNGDNTGYSVGFNAETGTVVALAKDLHLTPYLAAAYTHHEFGAISETGAASALAVDAWSQDSLRAKVGTGLNWFLPVEWAKLKLGLDVAYAHELLDTDSELSARFASSGSGFSTTAPALPQDAISVSPSLGLQFDESTSATLSYTYEIGLDSRSYQSLNFAIRKRF